MLIRRWFGHVSSYSVKEALEKKIFTFKEETQPRNSVFSILVTTFGLKDGVHYLGFMQNVVTMDDLIEAM